MPKFEYNNGKLKDGGKYEYHGYMTPNGTYDKFGYIKWNDDEYYIGQWDKGDRTGKGAYLFPDTGVYLGGFNKTNKDGLGIYSYTSGAFYFGHYKDNLKCGYGVYIYNTGDWVFGKFENDKIHGKAIRFHASTKTFEFNLYENGNEKEENIIKDSINIKGSWDSSRITLNKPTDHAFTYKSGKNQKGTEWDYNGQCLPNGVWEGVGLIEWKSDSFYFGEWKNDKREGTGYLTFASGSYYIGGFSGVNFHGKGLYCLPDKKKAYFSNYVDHKQEGHMFILYEDGSLYYGNAEDDKLTGDVFIIDEYFGVSYNTYKDGQYVSEDKAFQFNIKPADPFLNKHNDQINNENEGKPVADNNNSSGNKQPKPKAPKVSKPKGEAVKELDALIGLNGVKKELKRIKAYAVKNKDRNLNIHMAFLGNPGTGKTAVARLIGQILYEAGVLQNNNFVECSRQTLISMYIGETALKTGKVIEEAMGGVLFIDEAYALNQKSEKDFGKEAIVELLKAMEDHRGEFCCIMAGYTKEMMELFEMNPGFKSRVQFFIDFPDYSKGELIEIGKKMLKEMDYKMDDEALSLAVDIAYRKKSKQNFANAREVRNLLEKTAIIQALRTEEEMENRTILADDVKTYAKEHEINLEPKEEKEIPMVKLDYLEKLALEYEEINVTKNMQEVEEAVISLSVEMESGKSESSGFLITPCGYAVTCAHCVNKATKIKARRRILDRKGNKIDLYYDAEIVAMNIPADVAIIKLLNLTGNNAYINLLPHDKVDYDALDDIIMLGYPFGVSRFDNISTNVGRIVSYQKKEGSPDFINIDLSAKSGNSGSAVLNLEQGYAIGVLCGGSLNHNGELVEEVNYCRPISYIWDLVAKNQDEE